MGTFERKLPRLAALKAMSEKSGDNWWKDLLSLWQPAGCRAGPAGLRLAVRNGYLNFYLRGQSIARVGFKPEGTPYAETHIKYVSRDDETLEDYVCLIDGEIPHPSFESPLPYHGLTTLNEWIARADKWTRTKSGNGSEKTSVDALVAFNSSIIDLEMGLPAYGDRRTAPRMDCVALEANDAGVQIVFWEAKLINDSRLRATIDLSANWTIDSAEAPQSGPEILRQMWVYKKYLSDSANAKRVVEAYQNNCEIMLELHKMANLPSPMDDLVRLCSLEGSEVSVDPNPRLVIFDDPGQRRKGNWSNHQGVISRAGIPFIILSEEPYRLYPPGAVA